MSEKRSGKLRRLAVALVSLPLVSLAIYAATCNNAGTSTNSVFSVTDPNGKIEFAAGGCNVQFWNVSALNVMTNNLTLPHDGNNACNSYGNNAGIPIKASDTIVSPPTIYGPFLSELMTGTENKTFEPSGNKKVYDLPAGAYNEVLLRNGAGVSVLGSSTIKTLNCSSDGGITFAPGTYYIERMYHQARCNISVQRDNNNVPIGKVILHFNSETEISGGRTCVNIDKDGCAGNPQGKDEMARQFPDMLQFVVHNGKFKTQGNVHFAGGVLVEKDIADFSNGSPTTIIGEIIATGVKGQNNNSSVFYYKSTSGNDQGPLKGFSTMAPPAYPPVILSNNGRNLAYFAGQKIEDDGSVSGHLRAYKLDEKAYVAATPSWDAAELMSVEKKRQLLVTNLQTTTDSTFTRIDDAGVPVTQLGQAAPDKNRSNKELIFNPNAYNGAYLNGRSASSLVGRPWRTAPVIARTDDNKVNLVLFAADDGVLYAVNAVSGELVWGWVPKDILPWTAKPKDMMNMHPWGQLGYLQLDGNSYVVGTALSGALHFSLKLKADGQLDKIVWYDYYAGGKSPTDGNEVPLIGSSKEKTDNQVGAAPGGQAPVTALLQNDATRGLVAYIRDSKIFMRRFDSGAAPEVKDVIVSETFNVTSAGITESVTASPSTNLVFVNKNKLLFGDSYGQIKWFDPFVYDSALQVTFKSKISVTKSTSKLLGISATSDYLVYGSQMTLVVYDKENVNMVKWLNNDEQSFSKGWHISADSSTGVEGTDNASMPKLSAGAILSAVSNIYKNVVIIPFTVPPSSTTDSCVPLAYTLGPLDINTGLPLYKGWSVNDGVLSSPVHLVGQGEMLALSNTRVGNQGIVKGHSELGSTGAGNGGNAGSGQNGECTGDLCEVKYSKQIPGPLKRLQWRELTNY